MASKTEQAPDPLPGTDTEADKVTKEESATDTMSAAGTVELAHGKAKGVSAVVHKHGANLTSWKVDDVENIFVSTKAVMDGSKPIRGGIPLCFPAFGEWEFGPQHGFARSSKDWKVQEGPTADPSTGDVKLVLTLEDTEDTRKMWDFKFKLTYTVLLTTRALKLDLDVANTGAKDLGFTFALHTYYSVPDSTAATVTGLKGLTYLDKTDGMKEKVEGSEAVKVSGFVDRVYKDSPDEWTLTGLKGGRALVLTKENIKDTVVWNPWVEKAKAMADVGDEDYKNFICVEAVQKSSSVTVQPGKNFKASHKLAVKD